LIDNPEFETPSYLLIFLQKGRRGVHREGKSSTIGRVFLNALATFGSIWCSSSEVSDGELSGGIPLRFQVAG
jgi:hypothetical protein